MSRLKPFPDTVFAFEPSLLSESYLQFDNIISKFGPDNGKYLAALPGSTSYRKAIADELMRKLGAESNKYKKARIKLLPQGGKLSPYFYPFGDLGLNADDFFTAAVSAKMNDFVHHVISAKINESACFYNDAEFDPNDYRTKEKSIKTKVGNQNDTVMKLCQLLEPVISLHDELVYVDPYFNPLSKEYDDLWKHLFKLFKGKKVIHIHTQTYFSEIQFRKTFGDHLDKDISIVVHIYDKDRKNHPRYFFGEHGGWTTDRGIQLSKKDEIIIKFTALGSQKDGESRIDYLADLEEMHQYTIKK